MSERSIFDQLDDAVTAIIAQRETQAAAMDPAVAELVEFAAELRGLPAEEFRLRLKTELARSNTMSTPKMKVDPIPRANPALSAYLCFSDAPAAIEFYKKAFGAEEQMRLTEPDGKIGHAEIKIADTILMLSDEYPDYGAVSPQTLGGSPVKLHLLVDDVDAFAREAIAAGARLVRPIEDQFYGDRTGQIADPFGYTWIISTRKEDVSVAEMQKRLDALNQQPESTQQPEKRKSKKRREGFHSVSPYISVVKASQCVDFVKQAFGANEIFRTTGSAGGMHCEVKIGDSMVMIGGGEGITEHPTAIHLYIPDVDAAYQRAIDAGATSLFPPANQPYGERSGAVQDPTGNRWYIATTFVPLQEIAADLHTVTVYFHPIGAQGFIDFLQNAFDAEELMRTDPGGGMILHAKVRIGDSVVELGEAREPSQPMPTAIYLYVEDVDAVYEQALKAGATSVLPPMDQPYGDRNAWVSDPFGNVWYLATTIGA